MLRPSSAPRPLFLVLLVTVLLVTFVTLFVGAQSHTPTHPRQSSAQTAATHTAAETSSASKNAQPQPVLPTIFAGWELTGTPLESSNRLAADAGDAGPLEEFGFTRYELAHYTRDADTLTVKAMEFGDATGAYGAFTFYRQPTMSDVQIGAGGAFDGKRVLFWNGAILVDATFSHFTAMSADELRDLATLLPKPRGNLAVAPTLPAYLPPSHLKPVTVRYAIGPQAYQMGGGVLPSALVDFERSAEVVTAQYDVWGGPATLTLINYPDSDIAVEQEHAIQSYFSSHGTQQNPWTPALTYSNPAAIQVRRSGPYVAVTSGSVAGGIAQDLLQRVHYEANVTTGNSAGHIPDTTLLAQIILNVAVLVGIFATLAIVLGVFLSAGRAAWRRRRNKSGLPDDDSDFIRLNLKD